MSILIKSLPGGVRGEPGLRKIHFTAPPEFGGVQGRWTPEALLLCAIASCYTTTFRALAEYSKFEYTDLEVQVEGTIEKVDSGYAFTEVRIRPNLSVNNEEDKLRGSRLLQKAKTLCLVSRALFVPQTLEPQMQVNRTPVLV